MKKIQNIKNNILNSILFESIILEKKILSEFNFGKIFSNTFDDLQDKQEDVGTLMPKGMERIQILYNMFNRRLRSLLTKTNKSDDQQEMALAIFDLNKALDQVSRRLLPMLKKLAVVKGNKFDSVSDETMLALIIQLLINKIYGFEPLVKVSKSTQSSTKPFDFVVGKELPLTKSFFIIKDNSISISPSNLNKLDVSQIKNFNKDFPDISTPYQFMIDDNEFVFDINGFQDSEDYVSFVFYRIFPNPKQKIVVEMNDKDKQLEEIQEDNLYFDIESVETIQ
jgi:hypothetical protein